MFKLYLALLPSLIIIFYNAIFRTNSFFITLNLSALARIQGYDNERENYAQPIIFAGKVCSSTLPPNIFELSNGKTSLQSFGTILFGI